MPVPPQKKSLSPTHIGLMANSHFGMTIYESRHEIFCLFERTSTVSFNMITSYRRHHRNINNVKEIKTHRLDSCKSNKNTQRERERDENEMSQVKNHDRHFGSRSSWDVMCRVRWCRSRKFSPQTGQRSFSCLFWRMESGPLLLLLFRPFPPPVPSFRCWDRMW